MTHSPDLFAAIDASASGNTTVVAAPDATRRIRVVKYSLVVSANVTVQWRSSGGANLSGPMAYVANGGISEPYCPVGIMQTALGEGLVINLSLVTQVGGMLTYVIAP